jgi:hypothetical protein
MINWNTLSIPKTTRPMIREATNTMMALDWSSFQVGQDTLLTSSLYESLKYALILFISRDT